MRCGASFAWGGPPSAKVTSKISGTTTYAIFPPVWRVASMHGEASANDSDGEGGTDDIYLNLARS